MILVSISGGIVSIGDMVVGRARDLMRDEEGKGTRGLGASYEISRGCVSLCMCM